MNKFDPISLFLETIRIDLSSIKDYVIGEKYACIILKNGNIGMAANLIHVKNFDFGNIQVFDKDNIMHRLFLLAYFNANLNIHKIDYSKDDLFRIIDFEKYRKIVMIGYSKPMYKKLNKLNIEPIVFDYASNESFITKQNLLSANLKDASSVILTGTSIINNTFGDIVRQVNSNCDVFLTGPSVPLSEELFKTGKIKGIFGTLFEENKQTVIDLISNDKGTDCLKKYGQKVALLNK